MLCRISNLELLSTKAIFTQSTEWHTIHQTYVGYQYLLIFTKLLIIFDAQCFASFNILKKVNAIVHLRATKVLVMLTWLSLGIRLHFYTSVICLLTLNNFTIFLLCVVLNEFSDKIFRRCKMQISAVIDTFVTCNVGHLILACKKAIKYCLILVRLTAWFIDTFDAFSIYSCVKFVVNMFDKYTTKFKKMILMHKTFQFFLLCVIYFWS